MKIYPKTSQKNKLPKDILEQYKALCATFDPRISKEERKMIDQAFDLAWEAHKDEVRMSGDPYIIHPLNVAKIISANLKLGAICIISALLHDVVERSSFSVIDIRKIFGNEVAVIVEGLTKMETNFFWNDSKQTVHLKNFLRLLHRDWQRIIPVKLADRLDNMRTLRFLPKEKQRAVSSETKDFYVPIAHRLGFSKVKAELEDLTLKAMDPDAYRVISIKRKNRYKEWEQEIQDFLKPIVEEMKREGLIFRTQTRVKSIASIHRKLQEKKISFDQIYDLVAIRIILDCSDGKEKATCWQTYGIVTSRYMPKNKRTKDWVSIPRSNGYESLHLTVLNKDKGWVEVQIRSERMHKIASRGIAAHWKYKEKGNNFLMEGFDKWLKEITNLVNKGSNSAAAMERLKLGFYCDEVQVFTEEGEVVMLPIKSTLLDFAIKQYGEEGVYCTNGNVNKKPVPLDYVLKNGDQVTLDIDQNKDPDDKCLDIVVTPKASRTCQDFFKDKYKEVVFTAKRKLAERFAMYSVPYNNDTIEMFTEFINEKSTESLFYHLGKNAIPNIDLIVEKFSKGIKAFSDKEEEKDSINLKNKVFYAGAHNSKQYERASCCNPIPGEHVFGVLQKSRLIQIHTMRCKEEQDSFDFHKTTIVDVEWYNPKPVEVALYVYAVNDNNLKLGLIDAIKSFEIQSLLIGKPENGMLIVGLDVFIRNISELDALVENINGVKSVQKISRR